jgi:hypothetical protein
MVGKSLPRGERQARAVKYRHGVAARQQCRGDIQPDESRAAKDKDSHV